MRPTTALIYPGLLLLWLTLPVHALEIYQWTDEDGVVHFSQWVPEEQPEGVETVNIQGAGEASNGLGISEEDDPEGYQAHREQMDALWADLEARREADRDRQEQATRTEFIYREPEYENPYIFPGYGYRPSNRPPNKPGRPPNRPRPHAEPPSAVLAPPPLKKP